ncbi:MAG: hypothetical protein JNK60_13175, partial [Acidobacteria bacterium]|nr:hypothetical protein [Acidobacteriota bacterium]
LDPGPLLRAGGFDPAEVTPTKPIRYLLGGSADTHLAWTAALDGEPVRVEATFWKGQAVGFTVLAPDVPFWRQMPETQLWQGSGADWAMRIVAVFVFVFLLLLARRNAQLGRGDGPGSRRLLTFVLVGMGGGVILQGHYSFHRFYSLFTVVIVICFCVGAAVFVRLAYLAVEPPIRKRYPFLLVSWTRLLSGDYRNSLVARDALIGLTLGTSVSAARALYAALPSWIEIRGVPLIYTAADDLIRKRWVLGKLCEAPLYAIFFGFLVIGVLLLGRMLLRSDGRAWLAPFLLMTLFPIAGGNLALEVVLGMVVAGLYLLALRSGGLLSLVLAFFAFQSLSYTPMGLFEGVWYSDGGLLVVGLLSALAAVAAWLSTGGRAILPRGVLDAVDAE